MKSLRRLFILVLLLVTTGVAGTIGCSCIQGSPNNPKITGIEPAEGPVGTEVSLTLNTFNKKKDLILFGGVQTQALTIPEDSPSNPSKDKLAFGIQPSAKEIALAPKILIPDAEAAETLHVNVPDLPAGPVQITIRRGDYESDPVTFTVTGNDSDKDLTTTNPNGESDTPTEITPPAETPPAGSDIPLAYANLVVTHYPDDPFDYVELRWTVRDVQSAFLQVPINYHTRNTIPYDQYIGFDGDPFPRDPIEDLSGNVNLALLAVGSELDYGFAGASLNTLPLNYCYFMKPSVAGPFQDEACFAVAGVNTTSYNYANVFLPINDGHAQKTGTWKLPVFAAQNVFTLYYRDFENRLYQKLVKIARP